MAQPKLITIYGALSERERERFGEFVRSPFHNKRSKLINLVAHLEVMFAGEEPKIWDKHEAYHCVFEADTPGKKRPAFDELQLNNVVSDLFRLMEDFLAWQQFSRQPEWRDVMMVEHLLSSSMLEQADKVIRKKASNEMSDAYAQYRFNQLADQHFFQRSRKGDNRYLIQGQQSLEIYFLANQLRIWCELINRANVLSLAYDKQQFADFEQYLLLSLPKYGNQPTISIYWPILTWLRDQENDTWFIGFKEKLFQHIQEFPEQEGKDIIAYVQNYCVKRINEGKNAFLREWYEIAQYMLPLRLLHEGQWISQWTYKNIVTAGVRLKEFAWTEQFAHDYYTALSLEERDNAYQYNLAVIYYEKHDIDRAMQLLNRVHFSDPNYYLDAKTILLKIYYEHNAFEALISLRDTVKIYLLREKLLSRSQQMLYKNLFSLTLKLYKLRLEKESTDSEKWRKQFEVLKKGISENNLVANKGWLIGKMEEVN